MRIAAAHRLDEARVVIDAHDDVRIGHRDTVRAVEPIRETQRRRVRLASHDLGMQVVVARRRRDEGVGGPVERRGELMKLDVIALVQASSTP